MNLRPKAVRSALPSSEPCFGAFVIEAAAQDQLARFWLWTWDRFRLAVLFNWEVVGQQQRKLRRQNIDLLDAWRLRQELGGFRHQRFGDLA